MQSRDDTKVHVISSFVHLIITSVDLIVTNHTILSVSAILQDALYILFEMYVTASLCTKPMIKSHIVLFLEL